MKLKLKTASLKLWLTRVMKNIKGGRSSVPVLETVRLEADEEGHLTLDFTNLDQWQKVTFPADVSSGGGVLVNADRFSKAVGLLEDEEITLEETQKGLSLKGKFASYTFAVLPAGEFPAEPAAVPAGLDGTVSFSCTGNFLASAIEAVDFSLCKDDGRFALHSVKLEVFPKAIRMVTTDGRRLSIIDRDLASGSASKGSLLIPSAAIKAMKSLASDAADSQIQLYADERGVDLWWGDWWLRSKLQDAEFPNYKQVIPSYADRQSVVIVVEEWQKAVAGVLAIGSEENKLTIAGNRISLEAPEIGSAWMEVSPTDAEEVTLNPRYLLEALKAAPSIKAAFLPGKSGEPVVMTMPNQTDADPIRWTHVLMPIRTSGGSK